MSDSKNLVLVTVGPDRVGLVEQISESIERYGCNIEDSKMAVFAGEFAMIFLLSGAAQDLAKLEATQAELEKQTGLTVWVKQAASRSAKTPERAKRFRIIATSLDHPGIVHRLSTLFSRFEINIESMETQTYAAPDTGTSMFRMEAELSIPQRCDIHLLNSKLKDIERDASIDVQLSEISGGVAG